MVHDRVNGSGLQNCAKRLLGHLYMAEVISYFLQAERQCSPVRRGWTLLSGCCQTLLESLLQLSNNLQVWV